MASMGPCFRGMENAHRTAGGTVLDSASMGPCFRGMENQNGEESTTPKRCASMGPCFRGMENGPIEHLELAAKPGFNGAML